MNNNTLIFTGLGIAAVAAILIYSKKSKSDQKSKEESNEQDVAVDTKVPSEPSSTTKSNSVRKNVLKPMTIEEEDAIMDASYEKAKGSIKKGNGVIALKRYNSQIKEFVFEDVKNKIPNVSRAWKRLQDRMRGVLSNQSSNSIDENATFAFNGHKF
jgi:hypothetical protein